MFLLVAMSINVVEEEIKKDCEKDLETHHSRIHQEDLQITFSTNGGPDSGKGTSH